MTTWLGRLSPARRRLHLALLGVAAGIVVAVGVSALTGGEGAVAPVDQTRRGPVLLVPGYGGSTAALQGLREVLAERGPVEVVEPPGDGTGDLREQAENLAERVEAVREETGAPSVDLVGYSAGGVVVRWYVAELDGAAVTRRVVTVASPHHGTDLAALATGLGSGACPEACGQLDPDSDLLRELNRGDETPDGPQWLSVWTDDDRTVVPPDSAVLEGATSFRVQECLTGEVGHDGIIRSDPVLRLIDEWLEGDAGIATCVPDLSR